MTGALGVVLLPALGAVRPGGFQETLASVEPEIGTGRLVALAPSEGADATAGWASTSVPLVGASDALAAGDLLAFARPGDRWRPGTLAARLRPVAAHPTAALGIAGHALVDADGRETLTVPAPAPGTRAVELLLGPVPEAAAVVVKAADLDPAEVELLARPHGDAVVWSRLVHARGFVPSGEVAADVPLDPARHGPNPSMRLDALLAALGTLDTDAPETAAVRREVLRRLYLEGERAATPTDLVRVFGVDARAGGLVDDLQWALERQREALVVERAGRFAEDPFPDQDAATPTFRDFVEARAHAHAAGTSIARLHATIRRLEAEVYRRDAIIAALEQRPIGEKDVPG